MPLYYMSFCNSDRPIGDQFIGAYILEAPSANIAVTRANIDIGVSGEVLIIEVPKGLHERFAKCSNRLMSRQDLIDAGLEPKRFDEFNDKTVASRF